MHTIEELSNRLRTEELNKYDVRCPNPRFDEATKTLHFFIHVYAPRDVNTVEVPVGFLQYLCLLGSDGFEAASGSPRYKHEKEALASLLKKLWMHFTSTLIGWVEKERRKKGPVPGELWYSCFKVPTWFIQAVEEDTRQREEFKRI